MSLASSLKKTKVKLDLLTGIDMLLMAEKGIRVGICLVIYRHAKGTTSHKIFETNYSFHVKWCTTEKVEFLFFKSFLLVLTKFLI